MFVATLIQRYDVVMSGGGGGGGGRACGQSASETTAGEKHFPVPKIDQVGPSLGIMGPVKETELVVGLKERKEAVQ